LAAQTDGEWHGDAPYLLEDGWKPLLTGRDVSGWHGRDKKLPFTWFTTRGVRWEPVLSPKLLSGVPAPGGTILNGTGGKTVDLVTGQKFGDVELYLEFMVPQGSNSGVYLHSLYEIQVFDSWGVEHPKYSDAGGVYHRWINNQGVGGSAPAVNASRRPGDWQSFYIWFRAPRFDAGGKKIENARFIRVLHNGVKVQENVEVDGPTRSAMEIPEAALNPLMLQGDHGPVAYRNIYIRPLRPIVKK
jgi:hypothetical protein